MWIEGREFRLAAERDGADFRARRRIDQRRQTCIAIGDIDQIVPGIVEDRVRVVGDCDAAKTRQRRWRKHIDGIDLASCRERQIARSGYGDAVNPPVTAPPFRHRKTRGAEIDADHAAGRRAADIQRVSLDAHVVEDIQKAMSGKKNVTLEMERTRWAGLTRIDQPGGAGDDKDQHNNHDRGGDPQSQLHECPLRPV